MVAQLSHALAFDAQFAPSGRSMLKLPSTDGTFSALTVAGADTVAPGATSGMQLVNVVGVFTPQCTMYVAAPLMTFTVNVFGVNAAVLTTVIDVHGDAQLAFRFDETIVLLDNAADTVAGVATVAAGGVVETQPVNCVA